MSYFLCPLPLLKAGVVADEPTCIWATCATQPWSVLRRQPRRSMLSFISAFLVLQWLVCLLDGVDSGRHLLLFNFVLDLVFCVNLGIAAAFLLSEAIRGQTSAT